jgi:hypothetical protein
MKTLATVLVAVLAVTLLAVPAMATNFWTETFTYPNGPLVPNGGWATHSGAGGIDVAVSGGTAVGNMANAPDDNRNFGARGPNDATYACMLVSIPAPTTLPVVNNYFAHFKDSGTTLFMGRLFVLPVAGANNAYTFGISVGSVNATIRPVAWPSALNFNQTYRVVIKYDAAAGSATLWVNPVNELSPSITSNTSSGATLKNVLVEAFALRQSASGSPDAGTSNWTYVVDNLGVGTSFDDACFQTTPARASTWGQLRSIYR